MGIPDHGLVLMEGFGEFQKCFPEEVTLKLIQQRWWTEVVIFQRKFVASVPHGVLLKGQPWTRDAIRMVFWEPSCYKEACCSGAVFQCGKFILTWEVLYTILVMWMLIARPAQTVAWKDFVWHHLMSWVIDSSVHQQTTKLSDQNTEHLKSTLPMQFYLHAEEGPWICSTFLAYPFTFSLPPASHRICRLWGLGAVTRTWKNPRTKEFFSLVFCSELRNTQRIVKQISSLPVVGKQRHGRVFYYT